MPLHCDHSLRGFLAWYLEPPPADHAQAGFSAEVCVDTSTHYEVAVVRLVDTDPARLGLPVVVEAVVGVLVNGLRRPQGVDVVGTVIVHAFEVPGHSSVVRHLRYGGCQSQHTQQKQAGNGRARHGSAKRKRGLER